MAILDAKPSAADRMRSLPVAGATVVMAAAVAATRPTASEAVLGAVMAILLVPCSLIDLERRIIPNAVTGPGSLLAIALGLALDAGGEPRRLVWALAAGGFLLVAALIQPRGMGMGDVKLLGMMGLFLGPPVVVALFVALLGNIVTAAALAIRHGVRAARKTTLPFGPYLAVGGLAAALAGTQLIHAYLRLHG
jgi:leader peptidase (prepilin peptidase)/N-methyltransferase